MSNLLFVPAEGKTTVVANAVAATAAINLGYSCNAFAVANTSSTAVGFLRVTYYDDASDVGTGTAPTATTDMPVLPNQHIVRYVQNGKHKVVRTIASAADGNLIITPGFMV